LLFCRVSNFSGQFIAATNSITQTKLASMSEKSCTEQAFSHLPPRQKHAKRFMSSASETAVDEDVILLRH